LESKQVLGIASIQAPEEGIFLMEHEEGEQQKKGVVVGGNDSTWAASTRKRESSRISRKRSGRGRNLKWGGVSRLWLGRRNLRGQEGSL